MLCDKVPSSAEEYDKNESLFKIGLNGYAHDLTTIEIMNINTRYAIFRLSECCWLQ